MRSLSYDERPVRAPRVVVHPAERGQIIHAQEGQLEVALNPTAFALWELCDGRTTVMEMVDAVCDLFAVSPDAAERDVIDALARMRTVGILR